jgi:hypothetical protein
MVTSRWERFAPLTGVLFVLLTIAGIVATWSDSPEDFPAPVDEIVTYYTDSTNAIMAGSWLGLVGGFFLIWFGGSVRARLRDAGEERLGTTAFGGAVAAATVGFMVDAANLMGALRADEDGKIDPATATAVYDLGNGLVGSALPVAIAVFAGATSVAALRTGALPRWLGIFGAIVTVGLLILPIAFWFTGLALIWALVTSIVLYTRQPAAPLATQAVT